MRVQNWPELLADFDASARARPFKWGEWDCALMSADWIKTCTGVDPAETYRGRYKTAKGAARILRKGLLEFCRGFGFEEVRPMMAQRGDIAMIGIEGRESLGVVMAGYVLAPGIDGSVRVPLKMAATAWRVC